jgi:death on curing protein
MGVFYLTLEQAISTHGNTIDVSGGGTKGHLDLGVLEGVLEHIQNDDYYPEFTDKLTHLFFSACKFHCFQDGNKRIAITLSMQMLLFNGHLGCIKSFARDMENISYHVAAGNIDKELLRDIIHAQIKDELEDESLKLRIFNAISKQKPEISQEIRDEL